MFTNKHLKFVVPNNAVLDAKQIAKQITLHRQHILPYISKMQNYYHGKHKIYSEPNRNDWMTDTHVAVNFCRQITTTKNGYFAGVAPTVTADDDYLDVISNIDNDNDAHDKLMQHAQAVSICGVSYELIYTWQNKRGEAEVRYTPVSPAEMYVVYNDDIEPDVQYAVRYYNVDDDNMLITVYTSNEIITYKSRINDIKLVQINREPHYYDECPVIVYNNVDNRSDYDDIIPMQDAYNSIISNEITDIDLLHDALLVFKDLDVDADLLIDILQNRIIQSSSGRDKEGQIEWLQKPNDINRITTMLDVLRDRIHDVAMIPNMADDRFGSNLSGVAIKFKLTALESVVSRLEANFRRAMYRRYYLIANYMYKFGNNYDYKSVSIKFTRNLPVNEVEQIDKVVKLNGSGLASQQTLISQLPFVDDVIGEIERIKQDNEDNMSSADMTALLASYQST